MFNRSFRFPRELQYCLGHLVFEQIAHLEQHCLKRGADHDASCVVCPHGGTLLCLIVVSNNDLPQGGCISPSKESLALARLKTISCESNGLDSATKDSPPRFLESKNLQYRLLGRRVVCQNIDVIFPIAKDSDVDTRTIQFRECSLQRRLLLLNCGHDPNSLNDFRRTTLFEFRLNASKEKRGVVSGSRCRAIRVSFAKVETNERFDQIPRFVFHVQQQRP